VYTIWTKLKDAVAIIPGTGQKTREIKCGTACQICNSGKGSRGVEEDCANVGVVGICFVYILIEIATSDDKL
jgi:hypothetical protein